MVAISRIELEKKESPSHMAAVISKTSKLNEIREKLRSSERRYRALIENTSDAVSLISPDATILYSTASIEKVLGYTIDEFVGRNGLDLVHPDDRESAETLLSTLMEKPGESMMTETRVRHKNGSWIWTESVATNLLDDPDVQAIVVNF